MFIKRVSGLKTNPTLIAFLIGLQLSRCPMFRIIALMVSRMHKVTFGFVIPRSAQVLLVAFPVLLSILFSSWFMLTDRTEGPTLSKAEEVSGNEDVSPKLTRVDPVKVTSSLLASNTELCNFVSSSWIILKVCSELVIVSWLRKLSAFNFFGYFLS